jgi:hypothetical protein
MNSQDLIIYPVMAVFGVLTGLLAKRKNRDPFAWGAVGAFLPVLTLLVLASRTYVCPNCKQDLTNSQGTKGACPLCGPFKAPTP